MKNTFFKLCFGTAIAILIGGCATTKNIPDPGVPTEQVQQTIASHQAEAPQSMRINSRVDYVDELNGKRVVGQDLILSSQQPSSMRITISAFDKAVATLVTDGTTFSLIDVGQNVYVTGPATPENIAQILPVYLSAADLYRVISGGYPMDGLTEPDNKNVTPTWDSTVGGYKLAMPMHGGATQNVYYDWPSGDIVRITVELAGKIAYQYDASDFKSFEYDGHSARFPSQIMFSLPNQKTDVRLRIEKRDFDVDFSPAVFRLPQPNGVRVITLE